MPTDKLDHWGHVALIRTWRVPIMAKTVWGEEYVADTYGPALWLLRCDCGLEWEIPKEDFPGRRILKSCGRPLCPYTPKPKFKAQGQRGRTYTVYLTHEHGAWLQSKATAANMSFSGYLDEHIRQLIADELINS